MKRFTLTQKIVIGLAGVAAIVVLALALKKVLADDDEAPIIVRNGSMDFVIQDANDGKWDNNGNASWSYETAPNKIHNSRFWVRADLSGGVHCYGDGNVVHFDYSQPGFQAVFTAGRGSNGSTIRTQIVPKPKIFYVDDQHLHHPEQNDGGYISGVTVDGQPLKNGQTECTISKDNLIQVNVCSNSTKCQ
jgi:hypothetical protein